MKEVPLSDINIDEYYLDEDWVSDYIKLYKEKNDYPPIILGHKEYSQYNIIDGNHRANALNDAGVNIVKCLVGIN